MDVVPPSFRRTPRKSSLTAAAATPAKYPSSSPSSSSRGRGHAGSCSATAARPKSSHSGATRQGAATRKSPDTRHSGATRQGPDTRVPYSGSMAVAEDCDTVLQGKDGVLVHSRDLREGKEIARLTRAKLGKSFPLEHRQSGKRIEYQSVAVNCGLAVQGRRNIHVDVTGDDDYPQAEKPCGHGVGDRGAERPVADKLYQYCRQVAGLRNGDYFFAVGCKDVFCGNVLNIIKAKDPIVVGRNCTKRPSSPASPANPRAYNVTIDQVTKSEGLTHGAKEAYGGVDLTRAQFREQGTSGSS